MRVLVACEFSGRVRDARRVGFYTEPALFELVPEPTVSEEER